MREESTGELECEKLESYHIDLEYLKNNCYNEEGNSLETLLQLFIVEDEELLDKLRRKEDMEKAVNELERLSSDSRIIGLYDAEKVARKTLNTQLKSAKLDGIEEGEKNKQLEIAKNMKNESMDNKLIAKITGLSIEDIINL